MLQGRLVACCRLADSVAAASVLTSSKCSCRERLLAVKMKSCNIDELSCLSRSILNNSVSLCAGSLGNMPVPTECKSSEEFSVEELEVLTSSIEALVRHLTEVAEGPPTEFPLHRCRMQRHCCIAVQRFMQSELICSLHTRLECLTDGKRTPTTRPLAVGRRLRCPLILTAL